MSPAWRLFNDWAGAELLSSLPNELPLASRFYCGNRALGFIVIEDLGEGESLIDILLGDSVGRAKAALLAQAGILRCTRPLSAALRSSPQYGQPSARPI